MKRDGGIFRHCLPVAGEEGPEGEGEKGQRGRERKQESAPWPSLTPPGAGAGSSAAAACGCFPNAAAPDETVSGAAFPGLCRAARLPDERSAGETAACSQQGGAQADLGLVKGVVLWHGLLRLLHAGVGKRVVRVVLGVDKERERERGGPR